MLRLLGLLGPTDASVMDAGGMDAGVAGGSGGGCNVATTQADGWLELVATAGLLGLALARRRRAQQ